MTRLLTFQVHLVIALIGFLAFSGIIVWVTLQDISVFEANHQSLAKNEVTSASVSVDQFVSDRIRLIEAFAADNSTLLTSLYGAPDDEKLNALIDERLRRWFPSCFTFTFADQEGNDLVADIEGFVGDVCVSSIQDFAEQRLGAVANHNHFYHPEIHPQALNYHFDTMAPVRLDNGAIGVFFVSFYPDTLSRVLASYESDGHSLFLIHQDRENLIEVSSAGSRDVFGAEREIRLSEEELSRELSRTVVSGTRWDVVAIAAPDLLRAYSESRWERAVLLVFLAATASLIALYAIGRAERLRQQAAIQTQLANEQLEKEIAIKDRFFSIIGHDLKSPFTTLLGMSNLIVSMSEKLTKQQIVEYAEKINGSGHRVYELLDNLLEWARFQMEKNDFETSVINVTDTIHETVAVLNGAAEDKGLSIETNSTDLLVDANKNMVALVVRNLVANAIKFTQGVER